MLDRELGGDGAADAEPEHVDPREPQLGEHRDDVRGERGDGQRAIGVVRAPMRLEVERDQPTTRGQPRQQRAELLLDVEEPAVQEQQRVPPSP